MAAARTLLVVVGLMGCSNVLFAQSETTPRPFDQRRNFIVGDDTSWSVEPPSSTLEVSNVARPTAVTAGLSLMDAHVVERAEHQNRVWATLGAKLNKPVTLKAQNATLRQAVSELSRQIQVPIRIDERALEEEGLTVDDETGPLALHNMPADGAAESLLRDDDLELIVDGDSLLVTTANRADEMLVTRVYAVGDLATSSTEEGRMQSYQELLQAILQTTAGPWLDIDGTGGTVSPCLTGGSSVFVIRQSFKVHREIEKLLYDLRKARGLHRR